MNGDDQQTWGLIIDVLEHTGRAVGLVGDLARIYEGTQEAPAGAYLVSESRQAGPDQARPADGQNAEAIAVAGMPAVLAALGEASEYKRDRAAGCADCADQSCGTYQHRLNTALAYDSVATRLQHAIDGVHPDRPSPQPTAGQPGNRIQPQAALEREAGQ